MSLDLWNVQNIGRKKQLLKALSRATPKANGAAASKGMAVVTIFGVLVSAVLEMFLQYWENIPDWVFYFAVFAAICATLDIIAKKIEQLRGK